ncbi:MAG: sigma-54 dependent transcriptional regulator [Pirellulaceae bacterium]|nr:sigma-54 dependent transcriptional regulator [Pirellulaceae bacterium]
MPHVLIVDDEPAICWALKKMLQAEGHSVDAVSSAEAGIEAAKLKKPNLVVLDVRLPGMSGLDAIPEFSMIAESVPIILITAFGDLSTAVEAYQKKVTDYLTKPFDLDRAAEVIRAALAPTTRQIVAPESRSNEASTVQFDHVLVGHSAAMQEVFKKIALAAQSDVPVLLTGESGTGKELAAAAIHIHSSRREQPYIPIALPALNPSLIESELFGHVKGAFTGANERREGLFSVAAGGTVLLDEIGDLPLAQQVKLLRVLEQGHFTLVGDVRPKQCQARIIAATHQDLVNKVACGEFRQDLYFRLAVFEIRMPALRERVEDIPELCAHLLRRLHYQQPEAALDAEAMDELKQRDWPGNVRELRNALEHAALMARGGAITKRHLPASQPAFIGAAESLPPLEALVQNWIRHELQSPATSDGPPMEGLLDRFLAVVEPILLREGLEVTKGNRSSAADLLGMHRATLREKLKRYGIGEDS